MQRMAGLLLAAALLVAGIHAAALRGLADAHYTSARLALGEWTAAGPPANTAPRADAIASALASMRQALAFEPSNPHFVEQAARLQELRVLGLQSRDPALRDGLAAAGHEVVFQDLVPDDVERIATAIIGATRAGANVVLTSGGTGLSPNDVTPEATRRVIDREAPGIAEALRARSLQVTPHGMLSRGVAGSLGNALVVNLPGSPKAARESLEVLLPVLPHAVELLAGESGEAGHRLP